jgi:hypothetical protein
MHSFCSALDPKNPLDPVLVSEILDVLDQCNKLVESFRMVRDYIDTNQNVRVSLRLFRNRQRDARVYNMPELDEVAALIVGDIGDEEDGRDIVVRERDGYLRRIHETHAKYIPMQYPLLFPFGEDQYQEKIPLNRLTKSKSKKKEYVVHFALLLHGDSKRESTRILLYLEVEDYFNNLSLTYIL